MHKIYFAFTILVFASLLVGCAGDAVAQTNDIAPTDTPEKPMPTDTATPEIIPHDPPASCPITRAPDVPFVPPDPYPSKPPARYVNQFWYGSSELWTMLGTDEIWSNLPHNRYGYTQKIFWWSQDFNREAEPYPAFTVTSERLDVPSSPLVLSEEATNASADFGTAILTGVAIPTLGCWKITGKYKDAELNFVVWVAP